MTSADIAQAILDAGYVKLSDVTIDEESTRMALLDNIGWFIQEWQERPKSGKGSDRSDLMFRLARALSSADIWKVKE